MEQEANKDIGSKENNSSRQVSNSYEHPPLPYENINLLQEELLELGYAADCVMTIEDPIKEGVPQFEVKYDEREFNEMMSLVLRFSRHENGLYTFDGVKATLYYKIDVEPIVINGIDIMKLEEVMRLSDWRLEKFSWGKEVEDALRLISLDEDGKRIAVALWNNEFLIEHIEKPDFIVEPESELVMYPVREFSNKKEVEDIYSDLQDIQTIGEELSKLPIDMMYNSQVRSSIIERLIKGEQYALTVRTNWADQHKVFLQLKSPFSTQVKLVDNEGNEYKAGPGKVFENVSNSNDENNRKDAALLIKNRENPKGLSL